MAASNGFGIGDEFTEESIDGEMYIVEQQTSRTGSRWSVNCGLLGSLESFDNG